ncbi:DUF6461 domain-containing protein [Frankia sp. R43]|uniref:DUF6461 domain-containing protein n=1 Tax=Frankia sp. R43 TaxID=269536 RepID=UPI001F27B924|nr:DUF6461 domain-containing protein [Frankia sp. R43]
MAAFAGPPDPAQYWATRRPLPVDSGPASAADRMQAPAPVLAALAVAVAAVLPDLAGRVPLGPAAKLGRLRVQATEAGIRPGSRRAGAPLPPRPWPRGVQTGQLGSVQPRPAPAPRAPGPEVVVPPWPAGSAESPVVRALRALGSPLVNRLLGALELAVDVLPTAGAPTGVAGLLPPPPSGSVLYAGVYVGEDDEAGRAVITLDQVRRGATTLVTDLAWALAGHPQIAPLLTAAPDAPTPTPDAPAPTVPTRDAAAAAAEAAVAARHGAAHLALGVATAAVVLRELAVPGVGADAPAVIGVGLGAAVELLTNTPMPPAYAQAALARRRAEYLLPRTAHGQVQLAGHCFGLLEGAFPVAAVPGDGAFAGNGLVQVVPGGAVIRAGSAAAVVHVTIKVLAGPPEQVEVVGWDEVVDVSWTAAAGAASVLGPAQPGEPVEPGGLAQQTPPWPGEYRLRVHATGRDDAVEAADAGAADAGAADAGAADGDVAATQALAPAGGYIVSRAESYLLTVWAAPATAPIVHKRTDSLGYRLRGEQEPVTPPRPEKTYSWIGRSGLSEAATITVITGLGLDDVVRAFQADPQSATTLQSARDQAGHRFSVSFLAVDGAVLAVEDNGFMGSAAEVLRPLSAQGRAASIFWNINAVRRLNLAAGGELLATLELPHDGPVPAAAAPYLADLDLADYRDGAAKGLAAVARFTGYQVRPADLTRIEEADRAYLIRS